MSSLKPEQRNKKQNYCKYICNSDFTNIADYFIYLPGEKIHLGRRLEFKEETVDWSSEVQRGDCRLEFWSSDKCGIKVDNPAITSKAIVRTPELLSPDY